MLPCIAHYNSTFFVRSETFITHYLTHFQRFTPVCIAWKLENLNTISLPSGDIYSLQLPRYSPRWFINGIRKHLTGRDNYFQSIIKKRNIQLVHAHFGHNGVQALRLKRHIKPHIPFLTTFYGADLSNRHMVDPLRESYKRLFQEGEMFLVEGNHMKTLLVGLGCPPEKIVIQRIAIPLKTITYKEREPNTHGPVQLLFCGRFIEKKGLIYALEAVKRIWNDYKFKNLHFCVIGDGELKAEIEAYIDTHNMREYVELPGFLSYSQYLSKVDAAHIFIHPSVTASDGDSEGGAPTTILEAQAVGLPVISTLHADIPNIVVPGESALLSKERDIDHLTQNLLHLLNNPQIWASMGKKGRAFVEEFHDIEKEVPKLEEKYTRLLEN